MILRPARSFQQAQKLTVESLSLESITFGYENSAPLFSKLDFVLPTDKTVFVSGPIGQGQSTFLKLLGVLEFPQEGKYLINGQDVGEMTFEEFLPIRKRIGYSFDYGGLLANRTLRDNLVLPLVYHKACSEGEAYERAMDLAKLFDVEKQMELRPALVSGGLRKLICVIRAFILDPEMVVLDDPFTGLDAKSAQNVVDLIEAKRESKLLRHVFLTSRTAYWVKKLKNVDELVLKNGQFTWEVPLIKAA